MLDQITQDFEALTPQLRLPVRVKQTQPVQIEGEAFKSDPLGRHRDLTNGNPRDFSQA
jgi:hypothetical protein